MIRILTAITVSAFALIATSCCCTGEPKPPGLRSRPHFKEIPAETVQEAAPAPVVTATK